MKFDKDIITEGFNNLMTYMNEPEKYKGYSFDLPDGFNTIPVMDQVRLHAELMTATDKMTVGEKAARIMIAGKTIEVFIEKTSLGKVIMNGNASFDTLPVFVAHPFAVSTLIEVCLGDFLGKFLPPLKSTKVAQTAEKASAT